MARSYRLGLLQALDQGQLRYAVLDVFEEEPLPDSHGLWQIPGLFITSHTAAPTPDAAIPAVFQKNLRCYLAGEALPDAVQLDLGY